MLTELAGANAVRKQKDVPPPTQGAANAVTKHLQTLSKLFRAPSNSDYVSESKVTEYASAVNNSDRESSVGTRRSKSRKGRKAREQGSDRKRSVSRSGTKKNKCPHCKLFKRKKAHPNTPEDSCFWNKAWKGFRPDWVCREIEVKYKPRHKFSADMGEYPSESEDEE